MKKKKSSARKRQQKREDSTLQSNSNHKWRIILLLIVVSFAVYANSLHNELAGDDLNIIVNNRFIQNFENISNLATPKIYFEQSRELSYRPMATLSYMIAYAFFNLNTAGFHLFSILLHTLNVLCIYRLVNLLIKQHQAALGAALLFTVHPVLTEAINVISFNEDLLALFFSLLAFIVYLHKNKHGYIHVSLLYFIALLSKEIAITLPIMILLFEYLFNDRAELPFIKRLMLPFQDRKNYFSGIAATTFIYLILRFGIFVTTDSGNGVLPDASLWQRLYMVPFVLFQYIKWSLYPVNLSVDHTLSYPGWNIGLFYLLSFLLFAVVLRILVYRRYLSRTNLLGLTWFFITLTPVYHIIPLRTMDARYLLMGERFLYFAMFGGCLFFSTLFLENTNQTKKEVRWKWQWFFVGGLVLLGAVMTINRNRDWRTAHTVWKKTAEVSPKSSLAHYNLAMYFHQTGDLDKAITGYNKAISLRPDYARAITNLGALYLQKGMIDKAVKYFETSLKFDSDLYETYFNLGNAYYKQKRLEEAVRCWEEALSLKPNNVDIRNNLNHGKRLLEENIDESIPKK